MIEGSFDGVKERLAQSVLNRVIYHMFVGISNSHKGKSLVPSYNYKNKDY